MSVLQRPWELRSEGPQNPFSSRPDSAGPIRYVQAWLQEMPPDYLTKTAGPAGLAEVASLAQEEDPELLCRSWFNFALRQEQAGRLELAASAYQAIAVSRLPTSEAAKVRLNALEGKGSAGNRVEYLLGQFVAQTADPGMLGGMMLASTVFQGTRLLGLSRLLANPEAGLWTRGLGARLLASSVGFAAEVPTFLFGSKAIHQAMGRAQDWSPRALGREGLGLGLNLFLLKGFAALGNRGVEAVYGTLPAGLAPNLGTRASLALLPQVSSLAGIYLGHRAEIFAGLRPESDDATTLVDSLSLLLQFHVGGQFSGMILGPKAARYAQELELLSRLARPASHNSGSGFFWGEIGSGVKAIMVSSGPPSDLLEPPAPTWNLDQEKSALLRPLWMTHTGDGESSPYKFLELRLRAELMEKLEPGEEADVKVRDRFPAMVNEVAYNYLHTPSIDLQRYFQLILSSRLQDIAHDDDRRTTRIEQLAVATKYFRHVLEMNTFRRGVGSLYDHLMQEAFERVLQEGDVGDYEALVKVAGVQRRIAALESFFRERGWDKRYAFLSADPTPAPKLGFVDRLRARFPLPFSKSTEAPPGWLVRLQSLSLSPEAKAAVERYFRSYASTEAEDFSAANHNYIRWQPKPGAETRESFTPEVAMDGLTSYLKSWKKHPGHLLVLEDALKRAERSPVPLLHFDRIFKLLATRDLPPKLTEVAAQSEFNWGQLEGFLDLSSGEDGYDAAVAKLNGTVYTGYIYDRVLAEKFARFYHLTGVYVHEQEMKIRLGQFHHRAKELLEQTEEKLMADWMRNKKQREGFPPSVPEARSKRASFSAQVNYSSQDVLSMMSLRPTPVAKKAAQAIESGEVELKLLSKEDMRSLWKNLPHDEQDREPPTGLFVPSHKSPSRKPLIAITALDPELTRDQKIVRAIALPALVVHEFEHYLHRNELTNVHLSEMRSWLEEYLFMMQNGNLVSWHEMQETTPYGFGVYLRNLVDKDYVEGPRDVPVRLKR